MNDQRSRRPNIMIMLADDQGWGDLGLTGNHNLSTPHIDALANNGVFFEHFYVQPLCAPTRAEILTGRYYPRTGVRGVSRRAECMNLDEVTLADECKANGYATGCFGKWHSGSAYPYHPNGRGFDEFFGFCCGHWSHYFDSTLEHNGNEVRGVGYIADSFTNMAMKFIEDHKDVPFLCYVPFNTPHSPFQVPDRWFEKFKNRDLPLRHYQPDEEDTTVTRAVLAMCENIDWNVGRLVSKISELGLMEDTIIIYLSDNGPNSWRWNHGMRGKKGSTDEGGVRSPCVISWPGTIKQGRREKTIAGAIDLLPTLLDLAHIQRTGSKPLDGLSLKTLLTEEAETDRGTLERSLYALSPDGQRVSLRTSRYRAGGDAGGLFDMENDPGQRQDLSSALPDLHARLNHQMNEWVREVRSDTGEDRLIGVGYPEFPQTYLNAQDANPSGDITWSSVHPNASYFVNWHNMEDDITWEIEVQTEGWYDVTLMYACAVGDEGSEIEVAYGGSAVRTCIAEAFDPLLKDGDDRVPRNESYEKEFKPLFAGSLYMERGRGELSLQARTQAGRTICEVRTLKLKLVTES